MGQFLSTALAVLVTSLGTLTTAVAPPARAADPAPRESAPAPASSDVESAHGVAAVTLDGKVLYRVRGLPGLPAPERARGASQRIAGIAADRSVPTDSLRLAASDDRTTIYAGDRLVAAVIDGDAAVEGVVRPVLAEMAMRNIQSAIVSYRNDRSPRVLLVNTAYGVGATVLFAIALLVIRRAFRKLTSLAERRFTSQIEALDTQSQQLVQIVQAQQLKRALQGILKGLAMATILVLGYLYLHFLLGLYPWTRPLSARLLAILLEPLQVLGNGLLDSLPGLVFIAVLAILTRYLLGVLRLYFAGIDRETVRFARFDREWALPTYRILRLLIIAFAVVVAYPYIPGSSSDAFKGVSIFLGVVFSLGSSSVIANLMAGYTMIYRRAFKVGDRIAIDNVTGEVTERRLMVTHLRTIKNEEIVVPNSTIINSNIINYSTLAATRGLILHTTVGIGYETPWRQVEAMLRLAAERTPGLLTDPPPFVLQKSLGDFAVTYELNAYCNDPHAMGRLYSAMHRNILDVFNENGVQIMTPAYEGDPETPKVVAKDQWFQAPARPPDEPAPAGPAPRLVTPAASAPPVAAS
ncbi:MAG TPA: mechanosensitive ion channel domain-containing protein [Methylomirabilota bacterium]|nr:mechanosensitive ion channel domain-containing protein [Methylomirabilota bacterium]